jgi:predicted NBD/HSP70 family sugar kinase
MTAAPGPLVADALSEAARRWLRATLSGPDAGSAAPPDLASTGWIDEGGGLHDEAAVLMGCDIGGTKAQSVLCDLSGRVLAEIKAPTAPAGGLAVVAQIRAHKSELLAQAGVAPERLRAAGVGLPAAVDPRSGRLHRAPNVPDLEGRDLRDVLGHALELPVAVENDVNMAVLGEAWLGHGHGRENVVFVALGTGIGMGAMVHGRLLRGAHGAAGEIAALPIGADPFDPATHASGALESVISSAALRAAYSAEGGIVPGNLRELFERHDDAVFAGVLDELAQKLALAVLSICAVIDPSLVIFGGSVGSRPEVQARLEKDLVRCMPEPPKCRVSALGNRAGVLGAVRAARTAFADTLA